MALAAGLPTIFQDRENVRPEDSQATGSARAAAGAANWTKVEKMLGKR